MVREKISTECSMKSVKNMAYKVIIMPPAKRRLDMYVHYTIEKLNNKQAAKAILEDARDTKKRLATMADVLKLCDNPLLAKHGYRKIEFGQHKFIMIYRIQDKTVIVDGMFHELQDYEGIFINEYRLW